MTPPPTDLLRAIIKKFPEAKGELRNMIVNLDRGEGVVLTGITDLQSKLSLTKVFAVLRLRIVERGSVGKVHPTPTSILENNNPPHSNKQDKKYETQPNSVQLLRRRFQKLLSIPQEDMGDASDESSSSSSSSDKKKKKKSKKKKKKSKKKKDKKEKKRRRHSSDDSTPAPPAEATLPPPLPPPPQSQPQPTLLPSVHPIPSGPAANPTAQPSPAQPTNDDDDDNDDFGPSASYRQTVGEAQFHDNTATVTLPQTRPEAEVAAGKGEMVDGHEAWMSLVPEAEKNVFSGVEWRKGARQTDSASAASARAEWMASPAEKMGGGGEASEAAKRKRDEEEEERLTMENARRARDAEVNARNRKAYEALTGNRKSLMEQHKERLAAGEVEGEEGGGKEKKWDRERDFDQAGRVDTKRLAGIIGNAKSDLKSKFSRGARHYL